MKFEYITFKHFPINLGSTHRGIIEAKTSKKAELKLACRYNHILIIRRME